MANVVNRFKKYITKLDTVYAQSAKTAMANWIDKNHQVSVYVKGSEVTDERNKEEQPESL